VCIKKGAFGPNLPNMDLRVSRQHRFLAISQISQRMFNEIEILIAANKLTTLPDIEIESDPTSLAYFNLLCDSHEIVFANGVPTESLYLGPEAVKGLSMDMTDELWALYPDVMAKTSEPPLVRFMPNGRGQKKFVSRLHKNNKQLFKLSA